jgi:hypothetical protein
VTAAVSFTRGLIDLAPPPLNPTSRYYPAGTRKCYWMATTANYQAPTRTELNAGIDLTHEIDSMTGFSLTAAMVNVPDMGSRFVSQIPGALESSKNNITFYQDLNSQDIRQILAVGTTGFIVVLWDGDISGRLMDVFPVQVASVAPDPAVNKAAMIVVDFAPSLVPQIGATIPAG